MTKTIHKRQAAPLHNKLVTIRDFSPWYTQEIHAQRIIKRRLERRWRSSNMATDRDLYVKQCMKVNDLIFHSKIITRNMGHFAPALVVSG